MDRMLLSGVWKTNDAALSALELRQRRYPRSNRAIVACLTCRAAAVDEKAHEQARVVRVRQEMEQNVAAWLARKGLT